MTGSIGKQLPPRTGGYADGSGAALTIRNYCGGFGNLVSARQVASGSCRADRILTTRISFLSTTTFRHAQL